MRSRFDQPVFRKTLLRCLVTVFFLKPKARQISLRDLPAFTRSRTSLCRFESLTVAMGRTVSRPPPVRNLLTRPSRTGGRKRALCFYDETKKP
jgi:hypothetical protein